MEDKRQTIQLGPYVMVWVALVMLTGLTVSVAGLHLGAVSVLAAVAVAGVKGTLVLFHFMHLKHEPPVFKLMLALAISILVIILAVTFTDVAFR